MLETFSSMIFCRIDAQVPAAVSHSLFSLTVHTQKRLINVLDKNRALWHRGRIFITLWIHKNYERQHIVKRINSLLVHIHILKSSSHLSLKSWFQINCRILYFVVYDALFQHFSQVVSLYCPTSQPDNRKKNRCFTSLLL